MYCLDSPWFCWVSDRFWMDLVGFLRDWRRVGKGELRKKVSTIAMPVAGLLLLFWGLQRGYPLWTCFLAFFIRVLQGNQLFGNWIRFLESKLLLIKSEGCFEKDLLYLTLLAILKVNGANWLLVLEKKLELGKQFPLLPCWVHYWPCTPWTRSESEHDAFGNTKIWS